MKKRRHGPPFRALAALTALTVSTVLPVPAPAAAPEPVVREVAPEGTDPAVDGSTGSHLVALAGPHASGYLVLFYPGTGATPRDYATLLRHAASRGHHVVGLAYRNEASVNFALCPGQLDSGCHAAVRREILTGEDLTDLLAIDEPNSAFGRLRRLLAHLAGRYPEERWDSFLAEGEIAWERVIVAGHSQGGGHAAFTAKLHRVPRAVLFSATEPAPWTSLPGATPAEAHFAVAHELERNFAGISRSWSRLALPGPRTNIDAALPPRGGSQQLTTARTDCSGDPDANGFFHNCTSADDWLPLPREDGTPALADLWDRLFVLHPGGPAGPVVLAGPMGRPASAYIDPEVLPAEGLLTWQDGAGGVRLAPVEGTDGRFRIADEGQLLDTDAFPVSESFNGPEFGLDAAGWAVFYTKENGGVPSLWRARLRDGLPFAEPLTSGSRRQTVLASRDARAAATRLLFLRGTLDDGEVTWQDEDDPASETPLGFADPGVRWIEGERSLVHTLTSGPQVGELQWVDTRTGATRQLTADGGGKSFPYGFRWPEDGRLGVLALTDGARAIGLWTDAGDGGTFARVGTIAVPGAEGRTLGSPEPFVAGGHAWVSFVVREREAGGPAEVWLARADGEALWRCDDGEPGLARSDPETLASDHGVVVYYNVIAHAGYRLYRCASELPDPGRLFRSGFE